MLTLSGSKYPGDTEVENQANELCNDKLDSMLTDDASSGWDDMYYLFPTRFLWATGENSVTCLIVLRRTTPGASSRSERER